MDSEMEDRPNQQQANLNGPSSIRGAASCAPWWSAFINARADVAYASHPPNCRDYTRVQRTCDLERDGRTGRDILHCHETREQFRICTDSVTQSYEKLATTSIESREPILEGHNFVPARSWETLPTGIRQDLGEPSASEPALALPPLLEEPVEQPTISGRPYGPWPALADDRDTAATNKNALMWTAQVGQAVRDIFQFADDVQRDFAQQGQELVRRGEGQRRRPGFLARWFGGTRGEATAAPGNDGGSPGA